MSLPEATKYKVLIVGFGYIGQALAERLVNRKIPVVAIRRSATHSKNVTLIRGDVVSDNLAAQIPSDISHVVYCVSADEYSERAYHNAYVAGLGNLLGWLPESVERVIFVSSTAVYGQESGEIVDEQSVTEPASFSGAIMLDAESCLHAAPIETVSVRFGGIYGPGRERLLNTIRAGGVTCQKNPPLYTNRIHRDDGAAMLDFLLHQDRVCPCYVGVDTNSAPKFEVYTYIAKLLNAPSIQEAEEESSSLRGNKRCSSALLQAAGYSFEYPSYQEGYAMVVAQSAGI